MCKLQASRFFDVGNYDKPVFALSGAASEWLFSSGFWRRINNAMGTMFDQFEEDEAEPAILAHVATELDCCIRAVRSQGEEKVRFTCGWSSSREAHFVEIQLTELISELTALRILLGSAAGNGNALEFSL